MTVRRVCSLIVILFALAHSRGAFPREATGPRDFPFHYVGYSQPIGGPPRLDASLTSSPLNIGNKRYATGIGTQAPSRIDLALTPACAEFRASVGMDMSPRQEGLAEFVILVNGQEKFRSGMLRKGEAAKPVRVALETDATTLSLVVDSSGIVVGDCADWVEAEIITRDGGRFSVSQALRAQGFEKSILPPPAPRAGTKVCDVRAFGAVGDGVADDAPAFQKALEAAAQAERAVVHIPAGDYRLGRLVSIVLGLSKTGRPGFAIKGDGQSVANLLCDNPDGALKILDPGCKTEFSVSDLTVAPWRAGCEAALDFSTPLHGVRSYRTLTMRDVEITNDASPEKSYFRYGVKAIGNWRPLFSNVIVKGAPENGEDEPDGPKSRINGLCGIQADWCYAPALEYCYVWGMRTGYSLVCPNAPEGPEDGLLFKCIAVGCDVGADAETPISEPSLVISACHFSCREVGIRLKNRKYFQITDNLMYAGASSESPYTHILLTGLTQRGIVSNNIFQSPHRDLLRATPPSRHVGIRVEGKCQHLMIMDNLFNDKGEAIVVEKGAAQIIGKNNHVSNPHAHIEEALK